MADDEAEDADGGTQLRAQAPDRRPVVRFDPRRTEDDAEGADEDEPVADDAATDEQPTPEPGEGVPADAARTNGEALERPPAGAVSARPPEVTPPASVRATRLAESVRETGRQATLAAREAVSRAMQAARDGREPAGPDTADPTPPPTPTQPRGDGALVPHLDGGQAPLAERVRQGRRRVREATRRAMARTAELAGAFEVPFREDEEPATRGPTPPPTPTQPRGRGPLVPGLAEADHDGFRVLAVRPAGEAFADEAELAPVRAPQPDRQAPVPAPPTSLDVAASEPPEPAPTPPPRQPLEGTAAPPPRPTGQEAPEPMTEDETPDDEDDGLFARLMARFGGSENGEAAEQPDQEPAEAREDEATSGGLLSRLRDRFGGRGEEPDEAEEEPGEPAPERPPTVEHARPNGARDEPPLPPADDDRLPATLPSAPDRAPAPEQARPSDATRGPSPSPPPGEAAVPAEERLTSAPPDRAPAPEQARPGDARRGPTPAPPAAETPIPAEASLTPAPDDEDQPAPAPRPTRERTVPEDLHERIDEVLDAHEEEPVRVLEGDRR